MADPAEQFTFTRRQLAEAFGQWMADCPTDADGWFIDAASDGAESAETLLHYLVPQP